ncbi:MAG: nuclear transport factor 2 family protein [Candidatus Acidiferrales bacterium]
MNAQFCRVTMICCLFTAMPFAASGQEQKPQPKTSDQSPASTQPAPAPTPQARPQDMDTPEHILAAVYDCISGPAGPRDWNRFRSLFYSGARLISSGRAPSGAIGARGVTVDEYAKLAQDYFTKQGFFENSVANRTESWDLIAHVWSTYESRHAAGEKPFERGINSFQLFNDGKRWWIMTIYWEGEDDAHSVPPKYLSGGR